ncbi:MAG: peptidoglycan-binding protein [Alphaproteobacteria bacterium]|nr:peptidoglycan-binding protein [Alphaproteobacteria bacterium]
MRIAFAVIGATLCAAVPASAQRYYWPPTYHYPPAYVPPPTYYPPPAYYPPPTYAPRWSAPAWQHRALVERIQDELEERGYRPGPDDGVLDQQTGAAIREYQRDAGLPIDGEATPSLLDHMLYATPRVTARMQPPSYVPPPSYAPPSYQQEPPAYPNPSLQAPSGPAPTYTPRPGPAPGYVAPAYPPPGSAYAPPPVRSGDPDVAWVQQALRARGYDGGPPDGIFGVRTRAAIEAFQRANNLPVDGAISPALIARLR